MRVKHVHSAPPPYILYTIFNKDYIFYISIYASFRQCCKSLSAWICIVWEARSRSRPVSASEWYFGSSDTDLYKIRKQWRLKIESLRAWTPKVEAWRAVHKANSSWFFYFMVFLRFIVCWAPVFERFFEKFTTKSLQVLSCSTVST
jgi:hypothetical protein